MAKRKAAKKSATAAEKSPAQKAAQEALQWTWLLKGKLKSAQIAYLRIGSMLAEVRKKEMFKVLHHDDLEAYADERLNLGRSALYEYLQVYDWVVECHSEWLQPKPKGYIPVLWEAHDLMWIERRLADKELNSETRAKLEVLHAKGLEGKLRPRDMREFRERSKPSSDAIKSYLSRLRTMRRTGPRLKDMPAEAMSKMDAVIEVIENAIASLKARGNLASAA